MPELVCPDCGQVANVPAIRRAADEFCKHCDYPLFWAPAAAPLAVTTDASDAMLRRLPGVGGRMLVGTDVCPHCGELNPMGTVDCIRCGLPLRPVAAEPEPEPEPEPPPPPPPPPPEPEPRNWFWLWLIAVTVVGLATGAAILFLG